MPLGDLTKEFPKLKPDHYHKTIMPPEDIDWRLQTARELIGKKSAKIQTTTLASAVKELNMALISGCKSAQTSADARFNNRSNGALTYFMLKELNKANGLKTPLADVVKKTAKAVSSESNNRRTYHAVHHQQGHQRTITRQGRRTTPDYLQHGKQPGRPVHLLLPSQ